MDLQQQNRRHLELIQEESEQEDETKGSKTGEGEEEEEDFQIQEGVETKEVMAADESKEEEDDDDAPALRVMRPRRLSRSHSQESFPGTQPTSRHQEDTGSFSVSEKSSRAAGVSDEATPRKQAKLKWSSSGELRIKTYEIRERRRTPPKPPVQKKSSRNRHKKEPLDEELFPDWLVDLMVNIEEATTHQLLVE